MSSGLIDPIIFDAVKYMKIKDIRICPGNPRKHDAKNIEAIARAVVATRVMIPLVVGADNILVTGEGRLAAAKRFGTEDCAGLICRRPNPCSA